MSGCRCEPGVRIELPHPPYDCRLNPRWDETADADCRCVSAVIADFCPAHGHLAVVPEQEEAVA
jgi:hypothetical protein